MRPELFNIPFVNITVKSYGTLMVIGFLLATLVMRRMMKKAGQNPEWITNAALYALLAGVASSKLFYVIHHYDPSRSLWKLIFSGAGFEFLGGVLGAIGFLLIYLRVKKLPWRLYFDVLAVGLMMGLGFGRIGCFLNGCCHGGPADVPWAVRFPYGSLPYYNLVYPNEARLRDKPWLELPATTLAGRTGRETGYRPLSRTNTTPGSNRKNCLPRSKKKPLPRGRIAVCLCIRHNCTRV